MGKTMAVTGSTAALAVDEQQPRGRKLWSGNSFQRDCVSIDKPFGLYKPVFLKNGTISKWNSTIFCEKKFGNCC